MNKSFHGGGYGAYQSHEGVKGHRDVSERDALVKEYIGKSGRVFLDVGCNVGVSLVRAVASGVAASGSIGIDIDGGYIEYAKGYAKKQGADVDFSVANFSDRFTCAVDVICLFSVWDYFSVSSDVLGISGGENTAIDNIRNSGAKTILFECHADGTGRIEEDIVQEGKKYDSWRKIFNKIGYKKLELLGINDYGRRPFFALEI